LEIRGPAIVTGGGQGLGRAFCLAFAHSGVPVVVADIDGERAAAVTNEIVGRGGQALACVTDVADPADTQALARETAAAYGGIGVLVNNAAIFSTLVRKPFTEIEPDEWRRVLDVNVSGAFFCCQAVLPTMADAGYGKIVNISSATIWIGRGGYLHYVTSKAALIGMTRALASEIGPIGIRVNAITPGSTQTEVERETISVADRQAMADATALRRIQTPDDLVGAVLFLSSAASDFITGQTVNVDGGFAFH
jgi:3-oxoacyl-[acyl-carrier protein] reductase